MAEVNEVYGRCGSCRAFEVAMVDRLGRTMGQCDVKRRYASIAAHDIGCEEYWLDRKRLSLGAKVPEDADLSPKRRERRRFMEQSRSPVRRRSGGQRRQTATDDWETRSKLQEIPLGEQEEESMDREALKSVLAEVLDEALGISDAPMHERYRGGKVVIHPADSEKQSKEVDIDVLFRKIVTVRDKLRVLEQKVNSHKALDMQDKVQIQGYISSCYGSLKTFNFLFRDRDDWFGEGEA